MNIGVACGGTGGHIFPGLATAQELRARGHTVTLWLAGKDVESSAVEGWDGPMVTVPARGLTGRAPWSLVAAAWRMLRTLRLCLRAMRAQTPDVMLAMGSYASIGPVLAARRLGIPIVLHEANVIPGRAIRWLARWAAAVAVGFADTRRHLPHPHLVVTGMPLRRNAAPSDPEALTALDAKAFTVLVMGGSRGAHVLNRLASEAMIRLQREGRAVQVIHLTGPADEAAIRAAYQAAGVRAVVFAFFAAMERIYRQTTLAVCRSGASTCAELAYFGVPALLVPYPFATHQHQLANARAVERDGAADVRLEAELSAPWLADYTAHQMANPGRLARMRDAAQRRHAGHAAGALADLVLETARHHAGRSGRPVFPPSAG